MRLWGMRRAEAIVAYASHGFPVWDVSFSPFQPLTPTLYPNPITLTPTL